MDPADLNNLIEKAKSNASAAGAKKKEDKEKEKDKEKSTPEGEQETTNSQSAPGLANEGLPPSSLSIRSIGVPSPEPGVPSGIRLCDQGDYVEDSPDVQRRPCEAICNTIQKSIIANCATGAYDRC